MSGKESRKQIHGKQGAGKAATGSGVLNLLKPCRTTAASADEGLPAMSPPHELLDPKTTECRRWVSSSLGFLVDYGRLRRSLAISHDG